MQEGACQCVQGAQGRNNQIAHCPNVIIITAPRPCIDKDVPDGIVNAGKPLLLV
jgi:hypothetical protein